MPESSLPPLGVHLDRARSGATVRVWAPDHPRVDIVVHHAHAESRATALDRVAGGYHVGFVAGATAGTRYHFLVGGNDTPLPDPASRYQPEGPTGPSEIVDAAAFAWSDAAWTGIPPHRHVIYELHVGTFTPEGTYAAARAALPYLAGLGITTIELMPLAECAGRYNWGYDGVAFYAPAHTGGTPDDLRRFVDRAHACGIAVILDVVYNHFGPSGNTLPAFAAAWKHAQDSEWGQAPNFDEPAVRAWATENAAYWIRDFHLDGLRFDALQAIGDHSVIADLAAAARAAAPGRTLFLVGEDEPQDASLLDRGLDALWNDDFHHTARVAVTGLREGYLQDYRGTPQELVSAVKRGFLYQGQLYPWQKQPRGTPTRDRRRASFVHFLENHDQVANLGGGERLADLADPATVRAATALLLLTPPLPMLFQGQELGVRTKWHYFVDHEASLHAPVREGRATFVKQFPRMATPAWQANLVDPCSEATFRACALDPAARTPDSPIYRLHADLLALRRADPAFTDPRPDALDGAVIAEHVFALRFFAPAPEADRLLLVNLGPTFVRDAIAEPLLAPPTRAHAWQLAWSSEDPRYGGHGTPPPFDRTRLALPARSAVLLAPEAVS